jgi:hypothetical protein
MLTNLPEEPHTQMRGREVRLEYIMRDRAYKHRMQVETEGLAWEMEYSTVLGELKTIGWWMD